MRTFLVVATIALAAGCSDGGGGGGNGGGANRVDDPVHGTTFAIVNGVSAKVSTDATTAFAMIVMASTPDTCGDARTNTTHAGEEAVSITLRDVSAQAETAPTAPGTYTIYGDSGSKPPKSAEVFFGVLDPTCSVDPDKSDQAKTGTVTLTAVAGDVFSGSFDVTTTADEHVRGEFAPTACADLQLRAAGSDPGTCQPQ